jgi:hypothetical protein
MLSASTLETARQAPIRSCFSRSDTRWRAVAMVNEGECEVHVSLLTIRVLCLKQLLGYVIITKLLDYILNATGTKTCHIRDCLNSYKLLFFKIVEV